VGLRKRPLDPLECGERMAQVVEYANEEHDVEQTDPLFREFGQVDVLLNNAAAPGQDKWVWEQTLENFNATLAVDLTAAMLCTREVLNRSMLVRGTGSIINFSSTAAWPGMPRKTHYVSAKAALRALTKTVALEVGPKGIRCNCLVPGGIETDLWINWGKRMAAEQGISFEDWKAKALESVALRTISTPLDIAYLALFLASDESRTITGQSINCDAGGYMVG
jgi:NAD(P)-dependent dehydrogenase (short-subunit alcohol dehydrogenase family)